MNRRARRAAAARARSGHRTGYHHRLLATHAALADKLCGRLVHSIVEHDAWCDHYKGRARETAMEELKNARTAA